MNADHGRTLKAPASGWTSAWIFGFPPWLVQVEAKIWQPDLNSPMTLLSTWLAQVEANLAAGHVAEPDEATTEASSVACKERGIDVAIWWPDGASIHARWMACPGIRNRRNLIPAMRFNRK